MNVAYVWIEVVKHLFNNNTYSSFKKYQLNITQVTLPQAKCMYHMYSNISTLLALVVPLWYKSYVYHQLFMWTIKLASSDVPVVKSLSHITSSQPACNLYEKVVTIAELSVIFQSILPFLAKQSLIIARTNLLYISNGEAIDSL